MNTIGLFHLLAVTPSWAILLFVLLFATPLGFIFIVADRTSMFTNVSYSGVFGAIPMLVVVTIGVTVIQRGGLVPSWYASELTAQVVWAVACFGTGTIVAVITPWSREAWPDKYYYLIGGPLGAFLALPMCFVASLNGSAVEQGTMLVMAAIWACLVAYDLKNCRLDQPKWIWHTHGIRFEDGRYVCRKGR